LGILAQKAAEIEGRMKIAGIYGGASEKQIEALSKYGRNLGILLAVRAEYAVCLNQLSFRTGLRMNVYPCIFSMVYKESAKKTLFTVVKIDCNTERLKRAFYKSFRKQVHLLH
jgi:Na+/serine symporter